ncbi:acyltransferase [Paraburkholderia strydomiana]|uniref:acyltransferase family protein n=1 Tax=Paraburkholderia strydomiana TaxID=1245417 RepID=UPI0038BB02B9
MQMNNYAIWPTALTVAVLVLVLTPQRLFSILDTPDFHSTRRLQSLDGLRGFLALAVFFHHSSLGHFRPSISAPKFPSHFYEMLGSVGVSLFFMITGFLFWSRLISAQQPVAWKSLYIKRFFRIAPLYCFVAIVYGLATLKAIGVPADIPASHIARQAIQWLAFGMVQNPEPFLNYPNTLGIIGQSWSLYYEWLFYASLPLLALLARNRNTTLIVVALQLFVLFVDGAVGPGVRFFIAQFLCGMLAASINREYPAIRGDGPLRSIGAILLLTGAFRFCDTAYAQLATMLLGGFFALIAGGTSIFGLLKLTGARRLGDVSYSLYLMHGAVLVFMFTSGPLLESSLTGPKHFFVAQAIAALVLLSVCIATYLFVEKPGIALGSWLATRSLHGGRAAHMTAVK